MNKTLTQICSVFVTAAVTSTAFAAGPQLAARLGGGNDNSIRATVSTEVEHSLKMKTPKTVRRSFGGTRVGLDRAASTARLVYVDRAMRKAPAAVPELTGCVTYSALWNDMETPPVGLYTIPTTDGGEFELKIADVECTSGVEVNGSYYYMYGMDFGFFQFALAGVYNLETGQSTWSSSLDNYADMAIDMAFDKHAAWPLVYGLSNGGKTLSYYQFNEQETTVTAYKVADLDKAYQSIAVDAQGQLFVVDTEGSLYKMDKTDGKTTFVGSTGFSSYYLCGCTIDETSGKMYRTLSNDAPDISGVVEIDLTTGAGTLLCQFANEEAVEGLYVSGEGEAVDPNMVTPPYTNTFDTEDSLQGFTLIDANSDGTTWTWTSDSFEGVTNGYVCILYNSDLKMDDWLISVPVRLKGGETYEVSINAWTNGFDERVELCYGSEPTAQAMTNRIALANLGSDDRQLNPATVQGSIKAEKSGLYYIGIHGISDADQMYLNVDNFTVSAALSSRVPAPATDLTAVAAAGGEKSVTVSFKAPELNVSGDALSEISKIEVFRNGLEEPLKTFDAVKPGEALTFTDNPETAGTYTYTVYAYNSYGRGAVATAEVFCGINVPAAIAAVELTEDATPGNVTLSWTAVTKDVDGVDLAAKDVTYSVYGLDDYGYFSELIKGDLTTTEYSFTAVAAGQQEFVQFAVCAVTESGEGLGTLCEMKPVGTPYNGISESFANGQITNGYIWGVNSSDYVQWSVFTDEAGVPAHDGDNGFIGMLGQYIDDWGQLMTGKVDLKGLTNPGVSFYTYNMNADDTNIISVSIRTLNGEWVKLYEKPVNEIDGGYVDWAKVTLDLSAYANDIVQLQFAGTVNSYTAILFDKIKVGSLFNNDLEVVDIVAPAAVPCGESYEIAVNIANEGSKGAAGWSIELYADGEPAATAKGSSLAPGSRTLVRFPRTMSALATEPVSYVAKVVFDEDENPDNNVTPEAVVAPIVSKLPAVSDLKGEYTDGGVKLAWTAPDVTDVPAETVTDSFEEGESFAQEYAGWTFVDNDKGAVGGFEGLDIPGIVPGSSQASFFIFDSTYDGFNTSFEAHSGDKYLAALFNYDDSAVNDWAISPELSGKAQTISFYAKSYSSMYAEKIEVYYSTGSLNPDDFVKVVSATTVPGDWTLYSADLPDGATHFAIRSCATGAFMLMIDDATYTPAGTLKGVEIEGYNVYRNGERINAEPCATTEFVDSEAPAGNNTYVVTVVYNRGESRPSNEATVEVNGLADLAAGISIRAAEGAVIIEGAEGRSAVVAAADGKVIFSGVCDARTVVPAATGLYVVSVDSRAVKLLVK